MDNLDAAAESLPATDHDHQDPANPPPETAADSVEKRKRDGKGDEVDACRFSHSESELRPKPDVSWDPTSERAKKKMKWDSDERAKVEEEEELKEAENVIMMPEFLGENDPKLSRCLIHMPKNWKSDRLKEYLTEQSVVFKSATKKKGMSVGFLNFESEEQVESATETLHGKSLSNKNLKVANVVPPRAPSRPPQRSDYIKELASKSGSDLSMSPDDGESGEMLDETRAKAKDVRDVVTPLAYIPYPEQLEHKKNALIQSLKKLASSTDSKCS